VVSSVLDSEGEIGGGMIVAMRTKTHIHNLYAKLGTHRRAEAVERARALGLLAPSGAGRPKPALPAPPASASASHR
jgi:hypothetical protein